MSFPVRILIVLFFAYVLQAVFAYFQYKNTYGVISEVKKAHAGENVTLVTGSGKTETFFIKRGFYIILVVDDNDVIVDYWCMSGVTNFARTKQRPEFIGKTLDEVEATFTVKNEKKAFLNAREQLEMLRKYAADEEAQDKEESIDENEEMSKGGEELVS